MLAMDLRRPAQKKADVAEHPGVFDHVGLLIDEPLAKASCPFIVVRRLELFSRRSVRRRPNSAS